MRAIVWIGAAIGAVVLIVVIGVAGWQFDWWLTEKNVNRQVQIDNRNLGTQTAWRDEAYSLIRDVQVLPEGQPARANAIDRACSLIGRLTDPYKDDDLVAFQSQECSP
jgi:hypothetical protein